MMPLTRWRLPSHICTRKDFDLYLQWRKTMKTLKIVAILSTLILFLMIAEFAPLPLRFPNSIIAWQGILLYGYFLFCLSILTLLALILPLSYMRKLIIGMALVSLLFAGLNLVPLVFELIFITGLLIFYYSISKLLKNKKTTEDAPSRE
jgi:hypothetical protein